jgi:hypothetical protein
MTVTEITRKPQVGKKPQVAIMNAVHDLPVLVARDEGFFKDEGLDIDFVTTPGMAQVTTSHFVKFDSVFDRPLDSAYNDGGIDQFRMCEWGIMKRAVEAEAEGLRHRRIVALGASMSMFAIAVLRDSKFYEPEMLKDQPIAVTPNNGSHFTTLKLMEGFCEQQHIKTVGAGSMPKRLEALREGKVAAVSLMEPWISVAQKEGLRILIESHSTRSEAAGDDLDGRAPRERSHALHPLPRERDGGTAAAQRAANVAPLACAAAALHARALRRHLQLDGQVEHGRSRRHLREHRGQSRMGDRSRFKRATLNEAGMIHDIGLRPRFQ